MSKFLDEYWKDQNEKLEKLNKQYAYGEAQLKEVKRTADALAKLIAAAGRSANSIATKPATISKPIEPPTEAK